MAGKKDNYRKSNAPWSDSERKIARQEDAIERQKTREKRSALEQMQLIQDRPGESKREAMKLLVELT